MTEYIEISIETNPVWAEYVADLLIKQAGCSGVVTESLEYKDEEIINGSINIVKGYLWVEKNTIPDIKAMQDLFWRNKSELINSGIKDVGSWNLSFKKVNDEEWASSWKKFWHPQKIGSKIVICPSWEVYEVKDQEIKIELDPGIAFGTGTHPTTKLCIIALEEYVNSDTQIADIGTGSGILSIAGVKLGAKSAIGVDNDLSVIEVAAENARINNIADKCIFYAGSVKDIQGKFEIVVANILAEVLAPMMNDFRSILKENGKLILSGIIEEKANFVSEAALKSGFDIVKILKQDTWVAIVCTPKV